MAGETRKPTARRARSTTRTKKLAAAPVEVAAEPSREELGAPVSAATPADTAPAAQTASTQPSPEPREWVPVVYEGEGVFSDGVAGVFVTGTRTRLRAPVAARLLRLDGFRLAG